MSNKLINFENFIDQGVELSNIVTDSISEDHPIVQTIRRLETLSKEKPDNDSSKTIIENCDVLAFECCKGKCVCQTRL